MNCCGFNDFNDLWNLSGNHQGLLAVGEEWVQHTGISLSSEGASLAILNTNKYKSSERVQIKKC